VPLGVGEQVFVFDRADRPLSEEGTGLSEGVGQRVDIRFIVIEVQRRPRRGCHAQPTHERLGAVVPGSDADALLIEDLGQVVGMDIAVRQ
jgi:hypothetical protein